MKRILMIVGVISFLAAGFWVFIFNGQMNARYSEGWRWELNSLGLNALADEETGLFPETPQEEDPISLQERVVSSETVPDSANQVLISDVFTVKNAETGTEEWSFTTTATVDVSTGQHIEGELASDYYLIPKNAEKTTYIVSNTTYQSIPLAFEREEEVAGINTYMYAYYGDINNEAAYDYIDLEDGQEIICFDFTMEHWVEPRTGEIIQVREICPGDYVVDKSSGEQLFGLQRWQIVSTGDDLLRRTSVVNSQLTTLNLMNIYIPLFLVSVGVVALIFAFVSGRTSADKEAAT